MTDRNKPVVAFWATVAVFVGLVLLAYPLSLGPACWLVDNLVLSEQHTAIAYSPILAVINRSSIAKDAACRYVSYNESMAYGLNIVRAEHNYRTRRK